MQTGGISLGLYCHVPFCATACEFCAFYQEKPRRGDIERYLAGMMTELDLLRPDRPVNTVFWGGGTPGLLPAKDLAALGEKVIEVCQDKPKEWTVEMAPSTVKPDKLKVLKELGVTRISMGVQSFDPKLLEKLGRMHSPKQIFQAYERIAETGFEKQNLDLIIAIPGQTEAELFKDLKQAVELDPGHISTYCLTFEEDTALWVKLMEGKLRRDIDNEADLYEASWQYLSSEGYRHYEISNFARPGHECVHNLNTWRMHEWIGAGPSASSQWKGYRFSNAANLDKWLLNLKTPINEREEVSRLSPQTLLEDALIFGLRMGEGVDLQKLENRFPQVRLASVCDYFSTLVSEGLMQSNGHRCYALTLRGKLLADRIGEELLGMLVS